MFQLSEKEGEFLRFQSGTSKDLQKTDRRGGKGYLPWFSPSKE
jgi:hypothetical protein